MFPAVASALSPYHGWIVNKVEIEGIPKDLARKLEGGLALNLRSGMLQLRRPRLSEKKIEEDLQRIILFLARHGHPRGGVDVQIEPSARIKEVKVIFAVHPGPAVRFGETHVQGLPGHLQENAPAATAAVRPGNLFSDEAVTRTQASIDSLVQANGYARSEVNTVIDLTATGTADLEFQVEPGDPFTFESVTVSGAPDDLVSLSLKTIDVKPGTPYSPAVVEKARDNLRTLGLYRQIRMAWRETGPETLELTADLQPSKPRSVSLSVGSWTNDPWRIEAIWMHRNLLRKGRGFSVEASFSKYRRRFLPRFWWLALLGPRTRTEFFLKGEIQDEEAYHLQEQSVGVANLHDFGGNSSLRYSVSVANSDVEEKIPEEDSFEQEKGLQTIFAVKWFNDRSNNILLPTQGTRLTLGGELSPPGVLSESPFASVEADGVWYLPVSAHGVLVSRLNLATAWPLDDKELLAHRRLYAGGVNSHRAYRRRMLGPLNSDLDPSGGEARLLANAEVRFPLPGIFGGNLFLDVGQVWQKQSQVKLADIAVGLGAGVAVVTPVGPIRFDLARNVTAPPEGLPRTVFHVSVGNPF
jgi:outer membrane protein assembly factor BamA